MKKLFYYFVSLCSLALITNACTNDENLVDQSSDQQATATTRAATSIQNIVYIEANDVNPLNAGSYVMDGKSFFTHVILFAANIRGDGDNAILYNNPNIQHILDNKDTLVKPLQDKGIKVLLGLLGDHTGLGFANMTDAQVEQFATAVTNAVTTYNLDGVDFDDEWAEYGRNGYPSGSMGSFSKLITALRNKMPNKTITVFDYGYAYELSGVTNNIDYGINASFDWFYDATGFGMPKAKYAPYTINFNNLQSARTVKSNAQKVLNGGYGAIGYYDLKMSSQVTTLNAVAQGAFNSTCTYDGNSYSKNY